MLRDFRALRDAMLVRSRESRPFPGRRSGLRGWEYSDFLTRPAGLWQKEVPRGDNRASCWDLAESNGMLTILGRGFGHLIQPEPSSKYPLGLDHFPAGAKVVGCEQAMYRALEDFSWRKPAARSVGVEIKLQAPFIL